MMKDTRCQAFDASYKHIGVVTSIGSFQRYLSLFLSFSLFSETILLYLPVSPYLHDCRLPLVNVTRSRSPTKNLQLALTIADARRFASSCHGRLGPRTMLYLVWTDDRTRPFRRGWGCPRWRFRARYGVKRVNRDMDLGVSALVYTHRTFCAKCGCLVIEIECNLFDRCVQSLCVQ